MRFYIVDCFAEAKYQGNQLAVFLPDREISDEEMQQIAREMHFSETTFLSSEKSPNGGYDVRIFTPDTEIPFAGHPTLGTAFIVWKMLEKEGCDRVLLNMGAGAIPVTVEDGIFTMEQNQPDFGETVEKDILASILCISPEKIRDDLPVQWVSAGLPAYIIPLADEEGIKQCHIDHGRFQQFFQSHDKCNLLVFSVREEGFLKVRVFMDDTGFLEDPATGSANGDLAGYLLRHGVFGKTVLDYTVSQGEEAGRPSVLRIHAEKKEDAYIIRVGGKAFLTAEGWWR